MRATRFAGISTLLMVSGLAIATSFAANGDHDCYVNDEFGFSVSLPRDRPTCRADPGMHNTGIVIFLDNGLSNCSKRDDRPYVALNGAYNATDDRTPTERLLRVCGESEVVPTAILDEQSKTWPVTCRVSQTSGFTVLTFARQSDEASGGSVSRAYEIARTNYTAVMHLREDDFDHELKEAKAILRSVRFTLK